MRIEHIALNVVDSVKMADWYVQHLGMRVVRSLEEAPFTRFLADEAGRVVLEFYQNRQVGVPHYASMDPMMFHIAYVADNIEGEIERLQKAGGTPVGGVTTAANGDRLGMVRDPWGVCVQLVQRVKPLMS
jgi:catechol 2,3-dioxygenase-like lactoylglutathione lyase family enzyme